MPNHEMTAEMAALKTRVQSFINDEVIPQEPVLLAEDEQAAQVMAALKERARELGLWALGHPSEIGGGGLSLMDFAFLNEVIGRSYFGQFAVGSVSCQSCEMEVCPEAFSNQVGQGAHFF